MEVTCRCGYVMRGSKSELIEKVIEHGRSAHQLEVTPVLSWLVKDDPAVTQALAGWREVLAGFEPEPFRALA